MFAERLKNELKNNDISMYRLARDLKVSKQTVVNWCNGANEPKATQIADICRYFDCSADYILGLSDI